MAFLFAYPLRPSRDRQFDLSEYGHNYVYDRNAGNGVTVYILGEVGRYQGLSCNGLIDLLT